MNVLFRPRYAACRDFSAGSGRHDPPCARAAHHSATGLPPTVCASAARNTLRRGLPRLSDRSHFPSQQSPGQSPPGPSGRTAQRRRSL